MNSQGGYAITHVGKLERCDGKTFSIDEAQDFLELLSYYLSFARGIWTGPILLHGFNKDGEGVWQHSSARRIGPWQEHDAWYAPYSTDLHAAFPGFVSRWHNPIWVDSIKLAVHWYVESSRQVGSVEGAIALTQIALESLAWTLIVEDKGILDEKGCGSLDATNKLRLLLSQLGISLAIPSHFPGLTKFAASRSNANGPQALTAIRNMVIHANVKNLQKVLKFAPSVKEEAWYLGRHYLERALLRICDCFED